MLHGMICFSGYSTAAIKRKMNNWRFMNFARKIFHFVCGEVSNCFQVLFLYSICGNKVHISIMKIGKHKAPVIPYLTVNRSLKMTARFPGSTPSVKRSIMPIIGVKAAAARAR